MLSEGEQTCVALATYLTELATATHTSAMIERLIEEAQTRQVIVFTHDLVLLDDLDTKAHQLEMSAKYATVKQAGSRVDMYEEGLPWRAGSLGQRIDTLQKEVSETKSRSTPKTRKPTHERCAKSTDAHARLGNAE